jgi:Matrixin/Putative peptidoglycan binding domain/CARDB
LLLAMAAPQFVATTNGSTDPAGTESAHRTRPEAIEAGLEKGDSGDSVAALQEYLEFYGYMRQRSFSSSNFDNSTEAALKDFQRIFKLSPTGRVDSQTFALLRTPRFDDNADIAVDGDPQVDKYVLVGTSWDDPNLTYAFSSLTTPDLTTAAQEAAIVQALAAWSAVTPLVFTEVEMNQNPEIVISYVTGDHGDGYPFDGPSGVLAHAFYPPDTDPVGTSLHGDAHFDDAETWTVNLPVPGGGIDLVTVAIHELGHSLGLAHSNNTNAIMYAYYGGANRTLTSDDIAGIQALYGSAGGGQTVDAEVLSISMSPSSTTVGSAVTGTVQVRNNGSQAAAIPVTVSGPSNFTYSTTTASLSSGATTSFNFNWTPGSAGNFTLSATSNLSGDSTSSNNSKTSNTVAVSNPQQSIDAETVSASASPTSITQNSGNVTITAAIRNNGSATANIPITATGPNAWSSSTSRSLAAGASTTVQFSWPASVLGTNTFTVSTSLSGDSNAGNNSKTTNSVTVSSTSTGNTIFVSGIAMTATPNGNGYNLQAVISMGPDASAGAGAYIYGYWSNSLNQSKSAYGYANSAGQLTLNWTTTLTGVHRFQVYYVYKAGKQYTSSQNVGNPGSVDVGGGSAPAIDASVNSVNASPATISLNGGNVTITAVIGNNGDNTASIPVSISGPSGYNSSQSVSVGAGSTQQVNFTWPASVAGNHTFTVSTNLSGDSNSSNNQGTSQSVSVTSSTVIDAEVVTLTRSTSSVEQNGSAVTLTANVRNNGSGNATFTVRLSSGTAGVNTTQSVTLASGASQSVAFQWSPTVLGNHTFTAAAELASDSNAANNSKTTSVNVTQPTPPGGQSVYVSRTYTSKYGNNWLIYVWIGSTDGLAKSGAVITGTLSAASGQTRQVSATTGGSGYTYFYQSPVGTGSHTFTIDNISLSGYTYDSSLNVQTTLNLPS